MGLTARWRQAVRPTAYAGKEEVQAHREENGAIPEVVKEARALLVLALGHSLEVDEHVLGALGPVSLNESCSLHFVIAGEKLFVLNLALFEHVRFRLQTSADGCTCDASGLAASPSAHWLHRRCDRAGPNGLP